VNKVKNRKLALGLLAVGCVAVLLMAMAIRAAEPKPEELLQQADELFAEKNYKEASAKYERYLRTAPVGDKWRHAGERHVICMLRLRLFDNALDAAEGYIKRVADTPWEARAERFAGNLYMLVPHHGTRSGGKFHRAQWKQGIHVRSWRYDRKRAVAHMERARDLYAKYDGDNDALAALPEKERADWHNERIECIFDLANTCSRFGIYETQAHFWYRAWGERDEYLAKTAGEEDFDEQLSHWQLRRQRPIGLRLDAKGNPIFPAAPPAYSPALPDDQKILFLLKEARDLDKTANGKYTGLSLYRQGMLARARFGMDRLNQYAGFYHAGGKQPLKQELEKFNPWEMKDDEALVLAGGRIRKVALPAQWNVLQLLRVVAGDYGKSGVGDQAQYGIGLYYQTRQQYITALDEYAKLQRQFAGSEWAKHAGDQISRIREPQVRISQSGVQLPAEPAKLQLSYRNVDKVWFVARTIDHIGFLKDLRSRDVKSNRDMQAFWGLRNWHNYFVHGYKQHNRRDWIRTLAAKYIGGEVARWSQEVENDGSHRYARTDVQTLLEKSGACLVYACVKEPPAADAEKKGKDAMDLGNSRAVLVLSDLGIVEKKVKEGNLYFISEARGGAPVRGAAINVVEVWSTWDRKTRKSQYHKRTHDLKTDADGLAVLRRPGGSRGQLHVLVTAPENRVAWTGMSYWRAYRPSRMRDGYFVYCITDRPVYRPEQIVRFKAWVRQMTNGQLRNAPSRSVEVLVHDPRGNKVYSGRKQTDQYGGLDGEFTLAAEPSLGVYRIQLRSGKRHIGGQNFRVEEYKKPEFEVTVEPGTTHARLGAKLSAVIRAKYYFGAPVTDATVSYKVFREEYTHRYYLPGEWDWLYGPGYGLPWYSYDWFPWWRRLSSCWAPPPWWWGAARNPVRELVMEGKRKIGEDGTLKVEIDTGPALREHGDLDHRYVIKAEVRDASRRTISGEGAVKATRQAYYAFVQSGRGYYAPGEEMVIRIRCLTPDNQPIKTDGVVTVSSVVFGGPDNARIEETELKRWKTATDDSGTLEFKLRHEKSGQLKIKFAAPDKWGGVVEGYGIVWVCGRDFNGKLYRFNNLEMITDKRTYRPGETAHVMINTAHANSYVLFSDKVDSGHLLAWKLLHLPEKHTVVDIPVGKTSQPNFIVEATTVADTRVHQQTMNILVPPKKGIVKVTVKADKPEYRPGEQVTVHLSATTLDGEPALAQFAISAFDKSVLYIQPEYAQPIARFYHGHLRRHSQQMTTNLLEQFSAWGYLHRPFQQIHPVPPAWNGIWGPSVGDWRTISDNEVQRLAGGASGRQRRGMQMAEHAVAANGVAAPMAPMAAKAMTAPEEGKRAFRKQEADKGGGAAAPSFAEAQVRSEFADTAFWLATLTTDADGTAASSFKMPENLTTWKINAWGMTRETMVGQADTSAITTKNLLVRMQAPRFFMELDEVVISANVHNYLEKEKTARVSLHVPDDLLKMIGNLPATTDVKVPAGGEVRVDWRVKVLKEGTASLTVKALTDEESDAMKMTFPVLVHGMMKQVARTGSMRPDEKQKTVTIEMQVPEKRRPELSQLEVQYSPSLVGAMLDALPYCLYYPYRSSDQTVSRFLPAVLTLRTIRNMGVEMEDLKNIRGRLAEVRRIEKGERIRIYSHIDNPVFNTDEVYEIIQKALARLAGMQHGDGGWGWWAQGRSSPYFTSYVLHALCLAKESDVKVDERMITRGMNFLKNDAVREMRKDTWSVHCQNTFVAYVLSLKKIKAAYKPAKNDKRPGDLIERLYEGRDKLNLYGKALLTLALANHGDNRAATVLRNIMQYKEENAETEIAWFRTPDLGWWYWWNSDIETNAWILRAIVKLEPRSDIAPKLVKWLLNNRRNGYYWRSTRDTTFCIAAMSDFVVASGGGHPDYTLTLDFDNGAVVKQVKINKDNFFTYDNRLVIEGVALTGGEHTLKITKTGPGALYFNTYLRYFTKEEHITAAGRELKVDRTWLKLVRTPYEVEVMGAEGQMVKEKRLRYERVPVKSGDVLQSGDLVQIELRITSDNNYTYLAFEDMKAAGCEPVDVRSGSKGQEGFASYIELRDEKVVFFVNSIEQGEHLLRYRLRAEVPGVFHALPTVVYGVYVPELRANSDEIIIAIKD